MLAAAGNTRSKCSRGGGWRRPAVLAAQSCQCATHRGCACRATTPPTPQPPQGRQPRPRPLAVTPASAPCWAALRRLHQPPCRPPPAPPRRSAPSEPERPCLNCATRRRPTSGTESASRRDRKTGAGARRRVCSAEWWFLRLASCARNPLPYGPRADLQGGVPVASATNALQPNVGAPGPPSPLVAGDVNAIMAGMQRGTTPTAGTAVAGSPTYFGTGPSAADIEAAEAPGRAGLNRVPGHIRPGCCVPPTQRHPRQHARRHDAVHHRPAHVTIATLRDIANRFGLPGQHRRIVRTGKLQQVRRTTRQRYRAPAAMRGSMSIVAANPHEELSPAGRRSDAAPASG